MGTVLTALARRRTLVALALVLTLAGTTQGFAATLGTGTSTLAAGNATVASCQASGDPTGTYSVAYDPALGGYAVAAVTVTNLDTSCAGKTISLTLTGTGGGSLGALSGTVPAGGGSLALTPGSTVAAAGVTGVSVAIAG
jgi:hypothetical protein